MNDIATNQCPHQAVSPLARPLLRQWYASVQRLWTPWRMRYVGGGSKIDGCLFCHRFSERPDSTPLILHRGERVFSIMNLYPYNTGHLMLVPIDHVATPEAADAPTMAEIAAVLPPVLRAARRALGCHGFNIGMNVGAIAGAGIAEHLHQHIVPRWEGDANFMPILASTMVLPELIPVTYAKLRGELARELSGDTQIRCVALADNDHHVLVQGAAGARLPIALAEPDEPLWRAATRAIAALGYRDVEIAGWAGLDDDPSPTLAVTLRVGSPPGTKTDDSERARWVPVSHALAGTDGEIVAAAVANQAPAQP